jgi:uncharacterized protein
MKKCLRLSILAVLGACAARAVDWKQLKPQGYVSDFAGVIDTTSRRQLESYCSRVEQATGAQLALVTIPSLAGEPIEDIADTIYRAWGVGLKGKEEGTLLLLAIQDRRSRLEVGYGLKPILPDDLDGTILRQMRPALRAEKYGEAMLAAASTIGNTIAGAKHVSLNARLQRQIAPTLWDAIPWPVIVGGFFLLIWLWRGVSPRGYGGYGYGGGWGFLPGLLLGSMLSRESWGSRGSGGFGGYDSGDGFGAFGGGDSGGGGASSDW